MNWYAAYTKPRQERVALEVLERQSFETYLPLISSKRKRSGKWVETVEPVFSRYLFIRLEPGATSTASIRSTRGVTGLVKVGNRLAAVPESFVTVLLQTADAGTGVHAREPALFSPGEAVVLTNGPLANIQGIFKGSDGETRAIILMSVLGAQTEVTVPVEQLVQASGRWGSLSGDSQLKFNGKMARYRAIKSVNVRVCATSAYAL